MDFSSQWVVLAHILRPQGRKGEVLADLFTDFPERFVQQTRVWLAPRGFAELSIDSGLAQPVEVASHWLPVGRNAGRIVLHFAGVDSIEQAEKLAGKDVVIPRAERMPLDAGASYVSDLLGCTVYDHDQSLGVVEDVQFPTTPDGTRRLEEAAPLLIVVTTEGNEILVPFVNAYLLEVEVTAKKIRMALPEGLRELNHQPTAPSEVE
jgi:16S rRNA processing protein RimM